MKIYKYVITFIFLFLLGISHAGESDLFEFVVLKVVDGDTIKVKLGDNEVKNKIQCN